MDSKLKEKFLIGTKEIASEILSYASTNKHSTHWDMKFLSKNTTYPLYSIYDIYSGQCGIIIFLIRLYELTKDVTYLRESSKCLSWISEYCQKNPSNDFSFYTGRLGIAYTMLQIYEINNDEKLFKDSMEYVKSTEMMLEKDSVVDDFLGGFSGILIGLLHIHSISQSEEVLSLIDKFINKITDRIFVGRRGVLWDNFSRFNLRSSKQLCGFAHGAAGIAFTFFELGYYFSNPTFYWLAHQTLLYENINYDSKEKNWPDYRLIYTDIEAINLMNAFETRKYKLFSKKKFMTAWCHGAAGICLSRLRAYSLTKSKRYKSDALNALENCSTELKNTKLLHTYCHGKLAIGECFLEAYYTFKNPHFLKISYEIGLEALNHRAKFKYNFFDDGRKYRNNNLGMFNGISGLGYYLIRLINTKSVKNLLAPKLLTKIKKVLIPNFEAIRISQEQLVEKILEVNFKKSINVLRIMNPTFARNLKTEFNIDNQDIKLETLNFYSKITRRFSRNQLSIFNNFAKIDFKKLELFHNFGNFTYIYIKEKVNHNKNTKLLKYDFIEYMEAHLVLDPKIKIVKSQYSYHDILTRGSVLQPQKTLSYILIKVFPNYISEWSISDLEYQILKTFKKGIKIKDAIQIVLKDYRREVRIEEIFEKINLFLEYNVLGVKNSN